MRWARAVGAVLVLVVACSIETSVSSTEPDVDGAVTDTGTALTDAPNTMDVRAHDGATPPPDAPMPLDGRTPGDDGGTDRDAGGRDAGGRDGGPRPSCDDLYGRTNGYLLCEQRDRECMFFAELDYASCDDACAAGTTPGTCTGNEGNAAETGPDRCTPSGGVFYCDVGYRDHICICSRP
jgi:hypothetical protein